MTRSPLVSVLLPSFNAGSHLTVAVDSILAQTFTDFELLVLDDGSSDGSVEALAIADPRVHVVTKPNTGLADTLNVGLEAARGELAARMDADDIAHPERLRRQVEEFEADPDLVLLGTQIQRFGDQGRLSSSHFPESHHRIRRELLRGQHAMCHPSIMVRRAVALTCGGYWDYGVAEDWDLFLRLSEAGSIANTPDVLLSYRFHDSSINAVGMLDVRRNVMLATTNARRREEGLGELTPSQLQDSLSARQRFLLYREVRALSYYRRSLQSAGARSRFQLLAASLIWPEQALRRIGSRALRRGGLA